jgi:tRNA(Ile)-lysidine synthase
VRDARVRDSVRQFFVKGGIAPSRVIVAASGGIDSTALLLLLRDDGVRAAHVNHHLRGEESDADEAFVRDFCAASNIPLDVADGTLDPLRVKAVGIEAAAREVRYARLHEIRERNGAQWIATAHQKNDQAETVLMRLLTGSGIAGLRGIHPVREDGFIRPLLDVTRAELEDVLREYGVTAREDRSNRDPRFLRNRVRVFLRELDAAGNLARIAEQAHAQWPVLEAAIDAAETECCQIAEDATTFMRLPDNDWLRGALLQRHIRRLDPGARDFDVRTIDLDSKRVSVTKRLELIRNGSGYTLTRRREPAPPIADVEFTTDAFLPELEQTIRVERRLQPENRQSSRQLIQLPADAEPHFTVRSRRPGDRFHPLGFAHPKKLKDFLIDRKIARDSRDRLPLLCWNGEIVWIAGVEVSERFKVTNPLHGTLYEVWLEGSGGDDADHAPL